MYAENFKKHPVEQLTHVGVAALAGILLVRGHPIAGLTIMGVVCVRQTVEWAKRDDTPAIDLAFHLGGLIAGVSIGLSDLEIDDITELVDEICERYQNRN